MEDSKAKTISTFSQFELKPALHKALDQVGYETPTPIQEQTIALLLEKKDVLGQAQTGTGKTAAFALPLLSNLNLRQKDPQVLVLTPTRELAIQVAEAFKKYASEMKSFHVLPIYGGQEYRGQIRGLQRGVHVVVGTPGRVMDHMRRGTLKLGNLTTLVLDEADEMLRMGFIDDVEWILEQTPGKRQIALFSATMPQQIRRIATRYLKDPVQITIKDKTTTATTIRQRFWPVSGMHKLDALTRILEAEPFEAMLIFVRTKTATVELSAKLEARGYASTPLNGDIKQNQRERTIEQLKKGKLDILVATDVAARGLDVERISHVVNYDIPHDTEGYVHRIGRTGRAGRQGDAILFVAPREKRMLHAIERSTNQKIELMELPSTELINDQRIVKFKQRITDTLATEELGQFYQMIEQYQQEHNVPALEIAASLAKLLQGDSPFMLQAKANRRKEVESWQDDDAKPRRNRGADRGKERGREHDKGRGKDQDRAPRKELPLEEGMERFRLEVGHNHEVKPNNIVGAIANEAGLDSQHIGRINIYDNYSVIDLPEGMPKDVFSDLKKVWVAGKQLNISLLKNERKSRKSSPRERAGSKGKGGKKSFSAPKTGRKKKMSRK
ncbi:MAG: ATP-dependent RNA helicase [Deltaproteobacteria bacterium]|jgi:ATP-dependent RNA helicase DeaD|uniref:RNA helicase n=1 Tax=marine metagenome TaxID=408172 RepID=A0A381N630_9ZZZZ|nr:ATP-dependent RNA helicase [Deltaproteobacteria bacterium]MDP6309118.1 DEAD/DEAH box helicase [SAR324 cluster bacterium]MDP6488018.1 DEAD/DEAH box helicase [SAR324 cluster bacterium]MDP7170890.1 DEAD/DEAH box helicase [SAR324 cluster bacterium]MDP7582803.1 DEAD/DEAH box helicase [SAR324 cluster bacterium]|tara:strand:- start:982 stop:2823 length:1842 start_codon:yes stop_codon:yes gene_type:complete